MPYDPLAELHCFSSPDVSCITHLTTDMRRAEYRLSQLNDYLDGEGVAVDWEDDEGEVGFSQAGTSRGEVQGGGVHGEGHLKVGPLLPDDQEVRGDLFNECCVPYPMNFKAVLDIFIDSSSEEEEEEDINESLSDYSDDNIIDMIKMEKLSN
ncbi:hypothetical protein GIB67_009899 [Kingdonia uniflora]|uniref:Uncharacterized protein n=1 Tax=Kingdonia uniflora TaxID=39325 RepID=A0A7J7L4B1_9MAGN|nr:hypothetical protein GIB67_009899 [Kingdonia uniflora]